MSNEMKHLSKEVLQTNMPKLISEVVEALLVNKCYRQNICEIFYNHKNAVNVSKDLYTKVAEMLVQFEKKNMMLNIFIQIISVLLLKKVKNIS